MKNRVKFRLLTDTAEVNPCVFIRKGYSILENIIKSILIKDTTREEREQIIRNSLDCGGGCENCSSCWLGGGSPWDIYQDYIDGKREIKDINAGYMEQYRQDRQIL